MRVQLHDFCRGKEFISGKLNFQNCFPDVFTIHSSAVRVHELYGECVFYFPTSSSSGIPYFRLVCSSIQSLCSCNLPNATVTSLKLFERGVSHHGNYFAALNVLKSQRAFIFRTSTSFMLAKIDA